MQNTRILGVILAMALPVGEGCNRGPVRSSVRGEIRLDGKPIDGGQIHFIPLGSGGAPAWTTIDAGKYELSAASGPSIGKCRVEIQWRRKTGRKLQVPPGKVVDETVEAIPTIYNKESRLELDVTPNANDFSVDLKL